MWKQLLEHVKAGDVKSLARAISLVENEAPGYESFLEDINQVNTQKLIGITGAPGSGKSTLVDALIGELVKDGKKCGVLCVDPSSPFNLGALLGDRIRMSDWYNNPNVFIRSLATRGSLGGLNPKIIEITQVMKAAAFDYIIVETVGVGQSEIEIAGLADLTVVVLVPEGGDEIQTMKAGLMEIADVFVVNKSDRPGADLFVKNLLLLLAPAFHNHTKEVRILKTNALLKEGIRELLEIIYATDSVNSNDKKYWLLAERAFHLVQNERMKDIDKAKLKERIANLDKEGNFNLYGFIKTIV